MILTLFLYESYYGSWTLNYVQDFLEKIIKIHKNGYVKDKLEIKPYFNFYGFNWDYDYHMIKKFVL